MTELLTAAQMRAIEQAAIEAGEVTGLELMERAGRGVVEAVFEEWPELAAAPHKAVVLCGPGNNGGDGFVVARLLKEWGWEVEVFLYGDASRLRPDARVNYESVADLVKSNETWWTPNSWGADVVFDALFGTGTFRQPKGVLYDALIALAFSCDDHRLVSIDLPTGLCADSGKPLIKTPRTETNFAVGCDLAVTFHLPKRGHLLEQGPHYSNQFVTVDIGLSLRDPFKDLRGSYKGYTKRDEAVFTVYAEKLPEPFRFMDPNEFAFGGLRKLANNKFGNGHSFVLAGGSGKTGAARLAARGALRIGAGLVTLGVPGAAQMEVASQVTSIMLKRAGTEDEVASVLADKRINAGCLGPVWALERARGLVEVVLKDTRPGPRSGASTGEAPDQVRGGLHVVLDADALSAFEGEPEALFGMLHENCVLTPHGGEFARLFPDIAEKLNATPTKGPAYSKVDATRAAAKRAGCVVLFKGPDTVIAAPDGRCSINSAHYDRAAPWLATAGSGDVLAGFVTGLLARGFSPMQAAETAAWLHVECARAFGPGLIAEDLPEALPGVFRDLGV